MTTAAHPRVSILLPACLRSLQRQSEARWHCVLVDDGSQDDTLACARDFGFRDPRFEIVSTPHRGIVAALNTGLQRCRVPLIARMDADDLMHRHRLATQARALQADPRLAAVGCHVRLFPRHHLRPGRRIGVVPQRLLSWRDAPQRLSRTHPAYDLDRFTACKAAFLADYFLKAQMLTCCGATAAPARRCDAPCCGTARRPRTSSSCTPDGWAGAFTALRSSRRRRCRVCRDAR